VARPILDCQRKAIWWQGGVGDVSAGIVARIGFFMRRGQPRVPRFRQPPVRRMPVSEQHLREPFPSHSPDDTDCASPRIPDGFRNTPSRSSSPRSPPSHTPPRWTSSMMEQGAQQMVRSNPSRLHAIDAGQRSHRPAGRGPLARSQQTLPSPDDHRQRSLGCGSVVPEYFAASVESRELTTLRLRASAGYLSQPVHAIKPAV